MTLPSSGAISLNDVQGEHGGSNPISLSEYYGVAQSVPSSGNAISLQDFRGTYWEGNLTIGSYSTGRGGDTYYGYSNPTYSSSAVGFGSFNHPVSTWIIAPAAATRIYAACYYEQPGNVLRFEMHGQTSNGGWTTIVVNGYSFDRTAAVIDGSYTAATGTGWYWRIQTGFPYLGTSGTKKCGLKI